MEMESRIQSVPLNPDVLLAILDFLDIGDILAMRQVGLNVFMSLD